MPGLHTDEYLWFLCRLTRETIELIGIENLGERDTTNVNETARNDKYLFV